MILIYEAINMIISIHKLIESVAAFEKTAYRIYFPVRFFSKVFLCIFVMAMAAGILWYNILCSVSVFVLMYMVYYIYVFSSVWKIYNLSYMKIAVFTFLNIILFFVLGCVSQTALVRILVIIL